MELYGNYFIGYCVSDHPVYSFIFLNILVRMVSVRVLKFILIVSLNCNYLCFFRSSKVTNDVCIILIYTLKKL